MTTGGNTNRDGIEIPEARSGLDAFLTEIAREFGIPDYFQRDRGDFPARIHGYIGGNSVRAFAYFAQNFLRSLQPEQGAALLKQYGLHIPEEEKKRVREYLTKMGYKPIAAPVVIEATSSPQQIDSQALANQVIAQGNQAYLNGSNSDTPTFGTPGSNVVQ